MTERENRADSIEDLQSYKAAMKDNFESISREVAVKGNWIVTGKQRTNLLSQGFDEGFVAYPVIELTANSLKEA